VVAQRETPVQRAIRRERLRCAGIAANVKGRVGDPDHWTPGDDDDPRRSRVQEHMALAAGGAAQEIWNRIMMVVKPRRRRRAARKNGRFE
jgi:hypothetical protein